jgi:hypothetical protein
MKSERSITSSRRYSRTGEGLIKRQLTYNARLTELRRTICVVEALGFTTKIKAKI